MWREGGLTIADLCHLMHHGDLKDEAVGTGERQGLRGRGRESPLPGALEGHGAHDGETRRHGASLPRLWATQALPCR